jgi:hypothetical protein
MHGIAIWQAAGRDTNEAVHGEDARMADDGEESSGHAVCDTNNAVCMNFEGRALSCTPRAV